MLKHVFVCFLTNMESKNWGEFENNKYKLKDKCNKIFIRLQKIFEEKKRSKTQTKKIKDIDNRVNEIKKFVEKIKKIKILKNGKLIVKEFILSKDTMDKFEKEELEKERRTVKNSWFDCLIHYVTSQI